MKLRVSPTRIVLLRLRKRAALARRGHKLLKDKLEGLVKAFMALIESYRRLRTDLDVRIPETLRLFALAGAAAGGDAVASALEECDTRLEVAFCSRNVMGVSVPEIVLEPFDIRPSYSLVATTADFDRAAAALRDIFPRLLELAALEEAVLRLAAEVEKTRRRVNALEHILIPSLTQAIKTIAGKLDEADRADRARLTKIKDMLRGAGAEARMS